MRGKGRDLGSMTPRAFHRLVQEAIEDLPKGLRARIENMALVVEDLPPQDVLDEMGIEDPFDLLGLYQGVSVDRRGFFYGNVLPDKITLYQRSIEARCRSRQETVRTIREVILHEIGHYFGLDDEELQRLLGEEDPKGC